MKTGSDHLRSLRDGREVYIHGEKVADVTTHPAFRNSVGSAAHLYDFQSLPENIEKLTFVSPTSGDRVSRAWQLPLSYEDLVVGGEAFRFHGPLAGPRRLVYCRNVHGDRSVPGVRLRARRGVARILSVRPGSRPFPYLRNHQSAGGSL